MKKITPNFSNGTQRYRTILGGALLMTAVFIFARVAGLIDISAGGIIAPIALALTYAFGYAFGVGDAGMREAYLEFATNKKKESSDE